MPLIPTPQHAQVYLGEFLQEFTANGYHILGGPQGEILLQGSDGKLIAQASWNRALKTWAISDLQYDLKDPHKEH